jgi:hypothetical protein
MLKLSLIFSFSDFLISSISYNDFNNLYLTESLFFSFIFSNKNSSKSNKHFSPSYIYFHFSSSLYFTVAILLAESTANDEKLSTTSS